MPGLVSHMREHDSMGEHRIPEDAPVEIAIRDEMIRLGQFLKLTGVVEDGGEAREAIERGVVSVNDEVETRRGRQLHPGDVVDYAQQQRFVVTSR
jgi:ribosome-associated protein